METKLAKIEPIEFKPSSDIKYAKAMKSNKSWWSRAGEEPNERAWAWILGLFSWLGFSFGGISFIPVAILLFFGTHSGLALSIISGIVLLSLGGLRHNARLIKRENDKVLADPNQRFFFRLVEGVEIFNRRVKAWNGMLAALELGAEDKPNQADKENMHRMLASAREELARKVQLAEGLMLPPRDSRPEVAAYLEDLRDMEQELSGGITVPAKALNQNNFQEVLENEVALFEYAEEPKALPPKES